MNCVELDYCERMYKYLQQKKEVFDHFESDNNDIDSLIDLQAIEYGQQETMADTRANLEASSGGVSLFDQSDVDDTSSIFETKSSYTSTQSHQINN